MNPFGNPDGLIFGHMLMFGILTSTDWSPDFCTTFPFTVTLILMFNFHSLEAGFLCSPSTHQGTGSHAPFQLTWIIGKLS